MFNAADGRCQQRISFMCHVLRGWLSHHIIFSQLPAMESHASTFALSDGRLLGYAEYGNLSGSPIFYFHGFPGSRVEGALVTPFAPSARLIGIDRAGMGLSTYQPGRTFLVWPKDVLELADHLKI